MKCPMVPEVKVSLFWRICSSCHFSRHTRGSKRTSVNPRTIFLLHSTCWTYREIISSLNLGNWNSVYWNHNLSYSYSTQICTAIRVPSHTHTTFTKFGKYSSLRNVQNVFFFSLKQQEKIGLTGSFSHSPHRTIAMVTTGVISNLLASCAISDA